MFTSWKLANARHQDFSPHPHGDPGLQCMPGNSFNLGETGSLSGGWLGYRKMHTILCRLEVGPAVPLSLFFWCWGTRDLSSLTGIEPLDCQGSPYFSCWESSCVGSPEADPKRFGYKGFVKEVLPGEANKKTGARPGGLSRDVCTSSDPGSPGVGHRDLQLPTHSLEVISEGGCRRGSWGPT